MPDPGYEAHERQVLHQVLAALVARLGGSVDITDMDMAALDDATLVSQATADGLRLTLLWPGQDPPAEPAYSPAEPGTTMDAATAGRLLDALFDDVPPPGLAEVVIHEPACPSAPGGVGCPRCACDVAGLTTADPPPGMPIAPYIAPPGAVTLDGDMITKPWRYR